MSLPVFKVKERPVKLGFSESVEGETRRLERSVEVRSFILSYISQEKGFGFYSE